MKKTFQAFLNRQLMITVIILTVASLLNKCRAQDNAASMRYVRGSASKAVAWQTTLRDSLFKVLGIDSLVRHRNTIPLNPVVLTTENEGTYLLKKIEFNSTRGRRIKVILTIPITGTTSKFPAVVCIHGHSGTERIVYDKKTIYKGFANDLASANYITIAPFVSQHEVYENGMSLMGERLFDCIRAVDLLQTLPEVDTSKIGCAGLSLGGEMTMWLGAMDIRIKVAVSCGFLTKMDHMEQNHCMCWKFPGLRNLVDYDDIYSLIAPRPLMCQNGVKEPEIAFNVPLARTTFLEIQAIYTDFKQPEMVILDVHGGEHEVDVRALLYFIGKYLTN